MYTLLFQLLDFSHTQYTLFAKFLHTFLVNYVNYLLFLILLEIFNLSLLIQSSDESIQFK